MNLHRMKTAQLRDLIKKFKIETGRKIRPISRLTKSELIEIINKYGISGENEIPPKPPVSDDSDDSIEDIKEKMEEVSIEDEDDGDLKEEYGEEKQDEDDEDYVDSDISSVSSIEVIEEPQGLSKREAISIIKDQLRTLSWDIDYLREKRIFGDQYWELKKEKNAYKKMIKKLKNGSLDPKTLSFE